MSGALAQSCVSVLRSIRTIHPRCPSVCALQQRTSVPSRQWESCGLLSSGETTTKQLRQKRFLAVKAVDVSGPGTVDFPLITSMQDKVCFCTSVFLPTHPLLNSSLYEMTKQQHLLVALFVSWNSGACKRPSKYLSFGTYYCCSIFVLY